VEHRFDELAKLLAGGLTRRGALRQIGGSLSGALLAALGVGKARGDNPHGNDDCAHFCTSVFPPGPARGKCISDAAHGTGLCYQCGPAAPPGHGPLCGTICCRADQVCTNGVCACPAGTEECGGACIVLCPAGTTRDPDTCNCVATCHEAGDKCGRDSDCCAGLVCLNGFCSAPGCAGASCATFIPCSSGNPDCVCVTLQPSGAGLCVPGSTSCDIVGDCGPDFSCPAGSLCTVDTCCGRPVCVPVDLQQMCNSAAASAFTPFQASSGLTIAG